MVKQMTWNNNRYQYEYELEYGDLLTVSGDEFSEAVADREQEKPGADQAFEEMLDPQVWVPLAGDNPNVEIIKASERNG
jgi:hypothetical protein